MAENDGDNPELLTWHFVGAIDELKLKSCRKIYMESGPDLALFYVESGKFYLTDASCPHYSGPLDQGDIEDIGGSYQVTCPMHYYSFDLVTGESPSGLVLKTYKTEQRPDGLYALTPGSLTLTHFKSAREPLIQMFVIETEVVVILYRN
ncbi:hypothetical protein Btru_020978 [Bulinus truncatus]|nr:hypothetical protein Btru_020978 [Bulinus truncatus]